MLRTRDRGTPFGSMRWKRGFPSILQETVLARLRSCREIWCTHKGRRESYSVSISFPAPNFGSVMCSLMREHPEILRGGKSNTPLLTEEYVIVTGGKGGATLIAYERAGGEPAWMAGSDEASYSSPSVISIGGEPLVVSVNARSVTAHEIGDGKNSVDFRLARRVSESGGSRSR